MGEDHTRSWSFLLLLFIAGLVVGGLVSSYLTIQQISSLESEVSSLRSQVSKLWGSQTIINQNVTVYQDGISLSDLYAKVKDSVVLIRVQTEDNAVQGSGFIYNFTGTMVVVTNYHVVHKAVNISVTFSDGEGYNAKVLGKDPYADLAVLSVLNVPAKKFKPLAVVSSSTLKVGDPVIAIGNPYGLVGSMTTGVISALGRTITEEYAGGFAIANIIQTSTPINPGNSGGPLLNYYGSVVGITTAIVQDSQGLGFAIPSSTLLKEIYSLVVYGNYTGHPYMGVEGRDMDYETAQKLGVKITYGWLIVNVRVDGPSYGKLLANDIIVALNGTRIRNGDDLASYLEENTLPGNTLKVTVWRKTDGSWNERDLYIILGQRPPPPV
ncbi:MAG: S1C family serine protease [Candidatus Bathyarchaeales archaeon]